MQEKTHELGHVPHVNMHELESGISELESRLSALRSSEEPTDRSTIRALAALLRNRRNLVEMLKRERFI